MKKYILCLAIIAILCSFLSCTSERDCFGFSKKDFVVVEEDDTHGAFGDGSYLLILDCSTNKQKALELIEGWSTIDDMSEPIDIIMYGEQKDGWGYNLAEQAKMPRIQNGYYCFYDRHYKAQYPYDATDLLKRASFNFSLAVYDTDSDIMYYFEYDT